MSDNVIMMKTTTHEEFGMFVWEVRDEDGELRGTETDFGNAAEFEMVLSNVYPDNTFTIVKVEVTE